MYNGRGSDMAKSPNNNNYKKRPHTGSLNGRVAGGYKTQKIEIGNHQPQIMLGGADRKTNMNGSNQIK